MRAVTHSIMCQGRLALRAGRDGRLPSDHPQEMPSSGEGRNFGRLSVSGAVTNTQAALRITLWLLPSPMVKGMLTASIVLALVAAICSCSALPHQPSLDQMLATAKTPTDHELIAKKYDKEATDAQAEYERHQAGVSLYQKGAGRLHCDALTQDYQRAEQDASALAAYHRRVAGQMRSGAAATPAPTAAPSSIKGQ